MKITQTIPSVAEKKKERKKELFMSCGLKLCK